MSFLGKPAPPNYVPGLGRGATGFTTAADIGPGRDFPLGTDPLTNFDEEDDENQQQQQQSSSQKYKRTRGTEEDQQLFATLEYTQEDQEADQIYQAIDETLDSRRSKRRELALKRNLDHMQQPDELMFIDAKKELATVSVQEWESIPEVGDARRKRMKKQDSKERILPVPDQLLMSGVRNEGGSVNVVDGSATPLADLKQMGEARENMLRIKLDKASEGSGTRSVDIGGYLTDLGRSGNGVELGDIERVRQLLDKLIKTNPGHAPGWISAARVEEVAGKHSLARNIIAKGCELCPKSEDIWLEAARLFKQANSLLAVAVRNLPGSVKLWQCACKMENDIGKKRAILRRALEYNGDSVALWKEAIKLASDDEDAKVLLQGAVKRIPYSVELWLELARIESFENAKKILNQGRRNCPTSHEIWIAAAKLQEANGFNEEQIDPIIQRSVQAVKLTREEWLEQARDCEANDHLLTCQAIVRATATLGLEPEEYKHTWLQDAEKMTLLGSLGTARALYSYALVTFPSKKSVWTQAAFFESEHGTTEAFNALMKRSVSYCPRATVLWLLWAKKTWQRGAVKEAREILSNVKAFTANGENEEIWLAAFKLENEGGDVSKAKSILDAAMKHADSGQVWMKALVFYRQQGQDIEEMGLQAIEKYKSHPKLYIIMSQYYMKMNNPVAAIKVLNRGVKECPDALFLWIELARIEEQQNRTTVARSLLEKSRALNSSSPQLWLAAVRLEARNGNATMANFLLARAIQECPDSGLLWAEAIEMEPRQGKKSKCAEAFKKTDNDSLVLCAVARFFWSERKYEKARSWFEKATMADPDNGDLFAQWLAFEYSQTDSVAESVIAAAEKSMPKHGEHWQVVSKDDDKWKWGIRERLEYVAKNKIKIH